MQDWGYNMPIEQPDPVVEFLGKHKWKIAIVVLAIVAAYVSVFFLGKDNIIEEEVEKVIEAETGIKVDLTP